MNDFISRQGALDLLSANVLYLETESDALRVGQYIKDVKDGIRNLPAIEPRRGRWIPVTERLPEENGMYLVTMTEKAKAEELGFDLDEIEVSKMRYNSNGWQLPRHIPSWINEVVKDEVIAWMPVPEPYKEVSK